MAIIVSHNSKDAEKIEPSQFGLERNMQEYIYDNPSVIPLYEIDDDIRLFVAARELQTKSGPIDALGFDENGNIYVIETKLYQNPDKRTVVAQALDYGASLWKYATDMERFQNQLSTHTTRQFDMDFETKYKEFFDIDDATESMARIADNLSSGNIKFVVLMDKLHNSLRDLIVYINQNSQFDIYAVELEYYKHNEFEIMIPKLFGAEVKKEVVSTKTSKQTWFPATKEDFIKKISADLNQEILKLINVYEKLVGTMPGSKLEYYHTDTGRIDEMKLLFRLPDGKMLFYLIDNGSLDVYFKDKIGVAPEFIEKVLRELVANHLFGITYEQLTKRRCMVLHYKGSVDDYKQFVVINERVFGEVMNNE